MKGITMVHMVATEWEIFCPNFNSCQRTSMKDKHASIRLIGIPGSLRRHSYCTAILRTLRDELPEQVTLDIFELSRIPLYNEDHETEDFPSSVQTFKDAVTQCDGVAIVSPEYNHCMP